MKKKKSMRRPRPAGTTTPPQPSCVPLDERNGRFIGTIIKTQWASKTYYRGEVIALATRPHLRVRYDDGRVHIIDPRLTVSHIVYRPPRVGTQYQVALPDYEGPLVSKTSTSDSGMSSLPATSRAISAGPWFEETSNCTSCSVDVGRIRDDDDSEGAYSPP